MYEKAEMRTVMARLLKEAIQQDENIILLDADLARANGILPLFEEFPQQTLDVGVAESNMACVAAGLASYGYKPFIFTFAAFASRRICDQVMISIAYARQNVKIVGTDPGIAAELNGGTHMALEDVGVMRSIPSMVIFEPVDCYQLAKAMPQILAYEGPIYIRMFRKVPPATWFAAEDYKFDLFKADLLRSGRDVTLYATGIEVTQAMKAAGVLSQKGIEAEVINIHTIKPIDWHTVAQSAAKTGCGVVCENHNVIGGLGSAVAECLANHHPIPLEFIGAQDHFAEVGKMPYLLEKFQMDAESIVKKAELVLKRKKLSC
ncbi:MAG TPA: transketolase family protein [Clostridiales bacterium]|nr:transketolase family protein [Clostridiales bacterium]